LNQRCFFVVDQVFPRQKELASAMWYVLEWFLWSPSFEISGLQESRPFLSHFKPLQNLVAFCSGCFEARFFSHGLLPHTRCMVAPAFNDACAQVCSL